MGNEDLSALEKMVYPGRFIIIGQLKNETDVVIYGLSGRSESSQARVLRSKENDNENPDNPLLIVSTKPTDPKALEKGDPALLVYDALITDGNLTAVSNGTQTNMIFTIGSLYEKLFVAKMQLSEFLNGRPIDFNNNLLMNDEISLPELILNAYFSSKNMHQRLRDGRQINLASYEPDKPIYTPRISGIIDHVEQKAGLVIIKKDIDIDETEPTIEKHFFELEPGKGYMIATYNGVNPNPPGIVPSFEGVGRPINFGNLTKPKDIANLFYNAIGKYAVSVACVLPNTKEAVIKNLH
ncbi:MAG: IMP cyclohydrolase [Candidatus Woesearchaeota archaeon]